MLRAVLACLLLLPALLLGAFGAYAEEFVPAKRKNTPATYPISAIFVGEDGWVFLEFTVTTDGKPRDIVVTDSYPRGVFEQATLRAVPLWRFEPATRDGVPVEDRISFALSYGARERRGISSMKQPLFDRTYRALGTHALETAAVTLEQIGLLFERQKLSIAEAARYYALLTTYRRLTSDYTGALEASGRALRLACYIDNNHAVDGTHQERISSYMGLGQYDEAVDYFDSWRKVTKTKPSPQLVALIDKLRAIGAGKGQDFAVDDLSERCRDVYKE